MANAIGSMDFRSIGLNCPAMYLKNDPLTRFDESSRKIVREIL
jgi:hypothetical protein